RGQGQWPDAVVDWLALCISPHEQISFLRACCCKGCPCPTGRRTPRWTSCQCSRPAHDCAGQAGSEPDGVHAVGGWAKNGKHTIAFARRDEGPRAELMRTGQDARGALLAQPPGILRVTEP